MLQFLSLYNNNWVEEEWQRASVGDGDNFQPREIMSNSHSEENSVSILTLACEILGSS